MVYNEGKGRNIDLNVELIDTNGDGKPLADDGPVITQKIYGSREELRNHMYQVRFIKR